MSAEAKKDKCWKCGVINIIVNPNAQAYKCWKCLHLNKLVCAPIPITVVGKQS